MIGIASGLACALCVGLYTFQVDQEAQLQRAEAFEKYGGEQVEVWVAKRDLPTGETIDETCVEKRPWLAELLPDGAVMNLESVRGQQLGSPVYAGEVVSASRLTVTAADQLSVPQGLCALSVPARDVQTVGGALAPGMEADIYMTGPTGSVLLAPRVAVLAVGRDAGTSSSASWVTIAVAPSLVQEMVQAAQSYELYFTLPGDTSVPSGELIEADDVAAEEPPDEAAAGSEPVFGEDETETDSPASSSGAAPADDEDGEGEEV